MFSEPTTGAENDIEKVTYIARAMVTEYGMSDALGPRQLGQSGGEVFLGREFGHQANYSEEVAAAIDREIRRLVDEAHARARAVLTHHRASLDRMAQDLVEKETLAALELADILGPLAPWPAGDQPAATIPELPAPPARRARRAGAQPVIPLDPAGVPARGVVPPGVARTSKRANGSVQAASSKTAAKPAAASKRVTTAKPVKADPATDALPLPAADAVPPPAVPSPTVPSPAVPSPAVTPRRRRATPAGDETPVGRPRPQPKPSEP